MAPLQIYNFVDGEFVDADDGERLDSLNPATGEVHASQPRSRPSDCDKAVAAAKRAFQAWSGTPVARRADLLDLIADKIEEHLEELAMLESGDTGKPLSMARSVDIPRAASNFRFFAGIIRYSSGECHEMEDALNYTKRMPCGVAALISPWNLPLYLLTWKVAPALACGNTVVAKPSELSPATAYRLSQLMHEAGVPRGVVNIVYGLGPEAGQPLVGHDDVSLVSFTGGTLTGRKVAEVAAPKFKKLSLELGGKNAAIVFNDCDFEAALAGVSRSMFLNSGQICLCSSRVFVERSLYETFLAGLVREAKAITVGDPATCQMGSLISLGHLKKIESYVALALDEGGEIVCGGMRPQLEEKFRNGSFYLPTIVAGLSASSRCATEEIFGPVVTIHPFDTEEEVIAMHDCVRYGLAGSVWTKDLARGHRVAGMMKTGMVWVNTWLYRDLRVPFGGIKDSGVGREGGRHSIEFFTEAKNICIRLA